MRCLIEDKNNVDCLIENENKIVLIKNKIEIDKLSWTIAFSIRFLRFVWMNYFSIFDQIENVFYFEQIFSYVVFWIVFLSFD